jgi:crotonobetainyl-CoA:carnitine CoA-transferase CaiB-like acyl-CoA transferase
MGGPLAGVRIVELAGIGPAPFAAMVLADLGAEVVRVDRPDRPNAAARMDVLNRGRRSIAVDLKQPDGVDVVLRLAAGSDALIEGFRPGVAERLGVGPDDCLARNPRLVYGRMTGWGQEGPYAAAFAARPRDEWVTCFAGRDACVAPVLTTEETLTDPHLAGRGTVLELDGVPQPAPAPRFGGTPAALDRPPPRAGEHTDEVLVELGYGAAAVARLRAHRAVTG